MVEVAAHKIGRALAEELLRNQESYSPAQINMAKFHPHLIWVIPKRVQVTKRVRLRIFERDGPLCAYCSTELTVDNFTVDHVHPVILGGDNEEDNLTVACLSCNASKGSRSWDN